MPVHEARFLHLITQLSDLGIRAHLFGNVVEADQRHEVDDVTADAKLGCGLDKQDLMPGFSQPIG